MRAQIKASSSSGAAVLSLADCLALLLLIGHAVIRQQQLLNELAKEGNLKGPR